MLLDENRALLRPAFLKHQGQEVKTIGDSFLVGFTSAVAAVNCAVELQEALAQRNLGAPAHRQLQVRIGIHLGDVLHRRTTLWAMACTWPVQISHNGQDSYM